MPPIKSLPSVSEIVSGYELQVAWDVLVPLTADSTNLVANPSIETGTTGYTAVGGSIARSLTKQRRGVASLAVTPAAGTGDGVYYETVATSTNQMYVWSFDFWGEAGLQYEAWWTTTAGVVLSARVDVVGKGRWQRIQCPYYETAGGSRRLNIRKKSSVGSANTTVYYIDGMLVVADTNSSLYPWRYFDGDSVGFQVNTTEFYWNGTPHGSTSVMKAYCRAGGRQIPFSAYGLSITAMAGLGAPTPNNLSTPLALPGGAQYQRTLFSARTFDLVGMLTGTSLLDLDRKHRNLAAAFNVRRQAKTQPIVLQYTPINDCGDQVGEPLEIVCSLAGGLEGVRDNYFQENLDLKFQVYQPEIGYLAGTVGAALNTRTSFTAGYVARRSAAGIWGALNTSGLGGGVVDVLPLPDGRWLLGGSFTNAGGDANADYLCYYNPSTDSFSAVNATPLSNAVTSLLLLPTGNVLIGGAFLNAGGNANADCLALLTVATGVYSAVNATPLNGLVNDLALLPNNTVAIGGQFTNAGGDANADYLCKLTLSTGAFSSFSATLLSTFVNVLLVTKWGDLYVGGQFTNVGGFAEQDYLTVLRSPYTSFQRLRGNSALSAQVMALTQLSDGSVLIGGTFVDVNGDTSWDYLIRSIQAPPGSTTELPLMWSKPFSDITNAVAALAETVPGTVMVGGQFTSVSSLPLYDGIFQYSGSTILPLDLDLPGAITVGTIGARPSGEVIIGFLTTGTGYTSGTTSVNNPGSAPAQPIVVLSYAAAATVTAKLYSLTNLATGKVVKFNFDFLPGETLTINTELGTVYSNYRGNCNFAILPGSNLATWALLPETNVINIFVDIAAAANMTAYMYWTPAYDSLTDVMD